MKTAKLPIVKEGAYYRDKKSNKICRTSKIVKNMNSDKNGQEMILYYNDSNEYSVKDLKDFAINFEEII